GLPTLNGVSLGQPGYNAGQPLNPSHYAIDDAGHREGARLRRLRDDAGVRLALLTGFDEKPETAKRLIIANPRFVQRIPLRIDGTVAPDNQAPSRVSHRHERSGKLDRGKREQGNRRSDIVGG